MTIRDIYGPTADEKAARETARAIGENCTVYSRAVKDTEGYDTDDRLWFVEQDDSLPSGKIFGYETVEFLKKQYRS